MRVTLMLPKDVWASLAPGTYALGGTTRMDLTASSHAGWSSDCPDKKEVAPVLAIAHYARRAPDDLRMPMLPAGPVERGYQTHDIRLRHDTARLTVSKVDRAHRWIEGIASGEVSWIQPKGGVEAGLKLGPEGMCKVSNFEVRTEPFEVRFALHFEPRWVP